MKVRTKRVEGQGLFVSLDDVVAVIDERVEAIQDGRTPDGEEGGVGQEAQALRAGGRGALHSLKVLLKTLEGSS